MESVRSWRDCTLLVICHSEVVCTCSLPPLSLQLDTERQSLTEQLSEAQSLLEEREREVGEVRGKLESAMAASERQSREHKAEMEEVVRGGRERGREKGKGKALWYRTAVSSLTATCNDLTCACTTDGLHCYMSA